jgi:hypothetical protein
MKGSEICELSKLTNKNLQKETYPKMLTFKIFYKENKSVKLLN